MMENRPKWACEHTQITKTGLSDVAAAGGGGLRAVPSGVAIGGMVLVVVAILCYAAAIICHGIGLVLGAGRMERQTNPIDVF